MSVYPCRSFFLENVSSVHLINSLFFIIDYGCALQREILIQGRIYISENHICFHANIFGWITDVSDLSPAFFPFFFPPSFSVPTGFKSYNDYHYYVLELFCVIFMSIAYVAGSRTT